MHIIYSRSYIYETFVNCCEHTQRYDYKLFVLTNKIQNEWNKQEQKERKKEKKNYENVKSDVCDIRTPYILNLKLQCVEHCI